jgi:hypothetical protein
MSRSVTVGKNTYKMYQAPTKWVFVKSTKSGRSYPVAQIVDGEIVTLESQPALSNVSNRELAQAWLKS